MQNVVLVSQFERFLYFLSLICYTISKGLNSSYERNFFFMSIDASIKVSFFVYISFFALLCKHTQS